jgi:hypothetical protein
MKSLESLLFNFFIHNVKDKLEGNNYIITSTNKVLGNFDEKRMLVVCTQNSKSCTKDHFQHMIKTMLLEDKSLKDLGIHLIDKADATSTSNSSSFSCARKIFGDKPFNCRTRVYGNRLLISPEYKENTGKVIKNNTYIKSIPIEKIPDYNCAYVQKCQKRIINIQSQGVGGILFDILLKNTKTRKSQRFVICNSNLPLDQSDNILQKLTETQININNGNKLEYDLEIIMASPEGYINKKFKVSNNKKEVFSNIKKKLAKNNNGS